MSERIDRNGLYEEVWADPVTTVAARYGISNVGLSKICRKLKIPLPGRGYWAKVKAGRRPYRTPLPRVPDDKLPYLRLTKADVDRIQAESEARQQALAAKEAVGEISVPSELTSPHPLTNAASKRLKQKRGWTDEKGLRTAPSEVLNISVTRDALDRALLILDVLIKACAKHGINARIDAHAQRTFFDVNGTPLSLMISEHVKRKDHEQSPAETRALERYRKQVLNGTYGNYPSIPRYDYHPTGHLTIVAGQYPSHSWSDTARHPLEARLGAVIVGLMTLAAEIRTREAEGARREAERLRRLARYEFLTQRREAEIAKFAALESQAIDWERAQRLRAYVEAVEGAGFADGSMSPELAAWAACARAKTDWVDPLVPVSDVILGAPDPKKSGLY